MHGEGTYSSDDGRIYSVSLSIRANGLKIRDKGMENFNGPMAIYIK